MSKTRELGTCSQMVVLLGFGKNQADIAALFQKNGAKPTDSGIDLPVKNSLGMCLGDGRYGPCSKPGGRKRTKLDR